MQVIPVLDLLDGHAVRAVRGERSLYRPIRSSLCATSDPVDVARALVRATGSRVLYVADLGAILQRGAHADVIAALCVALGGRASLWLDAGFTDFASMLALYDLVRRSDRFADDAAMIVPVFGTETLLDPHALAEASARGFEPVLSLDHHGGRALGAWHDDASWWPQRVIVMTLDQVGAGLGPDLGTVSSLRARAEGRMLVGAGGVRHASDLARACASGAAAWLVASALHDGTLGFGPDASEG